MQPQGYNDPFHCLTRHILLENGSDFGKRDAAAVGTRCTQAHDDAVHKMPFEVLGEDAPEFRDFKGALSGHG